LVKDDVTYKTLEDYEYRADVKRGVITFLEQSNTWCSCVSDNCNFVQLAVDAAWIGNPIPPELEQVWAEMVTYYSDTKRGLKSETMGPHSYSRFEKLSPERENHNHATIKRYAGPNGSLYKVITV